MILLVLMSESIIKEPIVDKLASNEPDESSLTVNELVVIFEVMIFDVFISDEINELEVIVVHEM